MKKTASKKKANFKKEVDPRKHLFIDVSEGAELQKKESYTNQVEAEAIMDYYLNFI